MENFQEWLKPELIWFVLGFIFFLLEFAIPGLIVLFFGIGAWIVALICLVADPSLNVQLVVFIVTSLLSIALLRKWLQTRFFGFSGSDLSTDVELDDFVGKKAVVTIVISPEKAGKVEFQLGGLPITRFGLRCLAGETTVDFKEPNRVAMKMFDVNCSIGEIKLLHLGNARFREADINSGIGELKIDFSGDKIDGAFVKIDLDIGETDIVVPDDTGVRMKVSRFLFFSNTRNHCGFKKRGHYYYSENYEDFDNKLDLAVSTGIGEVSFRAE